MCVCIYIYIRQAVGSRKFLHPGAESWPGKLAWKAGLESWPGEVTWRVGLESWPGELAWPRYRSLLLLLLLVLSVILRLIWISIIIALIISIKRIQALGWCVGQQAYTALVKKMTDVGSSRKSRRTVWSLQTCATGCYRVLERVFGDLLQVQASDVYMHPDLTLRPNSCLHCINTSPFAVISHSIKPTKQ